ncbi:hypothetical protein [Ekhidna sp.]|uniref:hypothetical protein n=1 Tax=Ekhidna sp. TaxID=2608089 RepID=UPI003299979A
MKYKLDDIEKKKPFEVPEKYFEELPLKIQTRINEEKVESYSWKVPAWGLAMAASILLLITFIFIIPESGPDPEKLLAEVSQDELIAYLDQIELDEYDIASAFDDNMDVFELENSSMLDGIEIDDQALDDVLLEYDLEDEYL